MDCNVWEVHPQQIVKAQIKVPAKRSPTSGNRLKLATSKRCLSHPGLDEFNYLGGRDSQNGRQHWAWKRSRCLDSVLSDLQQFLVYSAPHRLLTSTPRSARSLAPEGPGCKAPRLCICRVTPSVKPRHSERFFRIAVGTCEICLVVATFHGLPE